MARCGRCGLFGKYPDDHPERHAGICVWYQVKLEDDEVYEYRDCKDYFESIPGMHIMDHFDYKVRRDNLGDAYLNSVIAKSRSTVGIVVAILGALLSVAQFLVDLIW